MCISVGMSSIHTHAFYVHNCVCSVCVCVCVCMLRILRVFVCVYVCAYVCGHITARICLLCDKVPPSRVSGNLIPFVA